MRRHRVVRLASVFTMVLKGKFKVIGFSVGCSRGHLTKRTKSYAKGHTCQVEVHEAVTDASDKANMDSNLTLFRTMPDVSLGCTPT